MPRQWSLSLQQGLRLFRLRPQVSKGLSVDAGELFEDVWVQERHEVEAAADSPELQSEVLFLLKLSILGPLLRELRELADASLDLLESLGGGAYQSFGGGGAFGLNPLPGVLEEGLALL